MPTMIAVDFWVALLAYLEADATLTTAFPGGFLQGPPRENQPMPYCSIGETDTGLQTSAQDNPYQPRFSIYAATDDSAASLMSLLTSKLLASQSRTPIEFQRLEDASPWLEAGWKIVPPSTRPTFIGFAPAASTSDGQQSIWQIMRTFLVDTVTS